MLFHILLFCLWYRGGVKFPDLDEEEGMESSLNLKNANKILIVQSYRHPLALTGLLLWTVCLNLAFLQSLPKCLILIPVLYADQRDAKNQGD